jgi:hypothetical protein
VKVMVQHNGAGLDRSRTTLRKKNATPLGAIGASETGARKKEHRWEKPKRSKVVADRHAHLPARLVLPERKRSDDTGDDCYV